MNDLNQIADLHNRRTNLDVVAARARQHGYPLLIWPEDKLLLRIADLPNENSASSHIHNSPKAWKSCVYKRIFFVANDAELRDAVQVDRAYMRYLGLQQFLGTAIAEYEVESL